MAQPPRTLCDGFVNQSLLTWNRLLMDSTTGIKLGEESVTDLNLLELQWNHPTQIITQKHSKRKEARSGADWEWWLGANGFWLGLRAQAKRIDPATLQYKELIHNNRHGRQVDLLINDAIHQNPPLIPIYIFYNYWDAQRFNPPWNCCTFPKYIQYLGCGISNAYAVRNFIHRGINTLNHISQVMYPWSCLVCCRGYSKGGDDFPFNSFFFLTKPYSDYYKGEEERLLNPENFITKKPPYYVTKILEGVTISEEEWSSIPARRITVIKR